MNRFLSLLTYALFSLQSHWRKYLLLWSVYVVLVALFASVVMLTSALRRESVSLLSQGSPDLWIQKISGGRLLPMPESFADSLLTFRGVSRVLPRVWGYLFDSPTGGLLTVMGIDSLPDLPYLSGYRGKLKAGEMLCGTGILELRQLQIGDALTLENSQGQLSTFLIVGAFETQADLLTRDLLLLSRHDAKELLGYDSLEVTDFALVIPNNLEVNNIERKIARKFGGLRLANRSQLAATYASVLGWRGGLFTLGFVLSAATFLVLIWDKSASFSGSERRESVLLKALGWSVSDILTMRFLEGAVICVSAALAGIFLAYVHIFWLDAIWIKVMISGWSSLYPNFSLDASLHLEDVGVVMAFAVLPYLAASLVPAWLSAVLSAEEALR
jgi:hypothetical protein